MTNKEEPREQLEKEVKTLRKRIIDLEKIEDEYKRAKKFLRKSEDRFRTHFENVGDVIYTTDCDLKITSMTPSVEQFLGYHPDEIVGHKIYELEILDPDYFNDAMANTRQVFSGKTIGAIEYGFISKDGRKILSEIRSAPVFESGKVVGTISVARDITGRKEAEEALRQSEERYRTIVNNSLTGIYIAQDRKLKFVNKRFIELSGYTEEELLDKSTEELIYPEDREFVKEILSKRLSGEDAGQHYEYRVVVKSGDVRWIEIFGARIKYQGKPAILATFIDITDRKRLEEELLDTTNHLENLLENANDIIYTMDLHGNITFINRLAEEIMGYKREDWVGGDIRSIVHPDDLPGTLETFEKVANGQPRDSELRYYAKDGRLHTFSTHEVPIFKNGKVTGIFGIARDITERKAAEEALRNSEAKYRDLVENMGDVIYSIDLQGLMTYVSPAIDSLVGYSQSKIIGKSVTEFIHPDDWPQMQVNMAKTYSPEDGPNEYRFRAQDGSFRWIRISSRPTIRDGQTVGWQGVLSDITERKTAEKALKKSEEKYRALFEESKDAIFIATLEGKILDINPAGVELYGYPSKEEFLKIDNAGELYVNPNDRNRNIGILEEKGFVRDNETVMKRKDGRHVIVQTTATAVKDNEGRVVAYRGIARDITEQRRLEQQLFQAQKMESIGTLAGGIAHDFNNILGGILGYASFMKTRISQDHQFFNYIDTIEKGAMRAAELTSQLLAFARGGKYDVRPLDLNKLIDETLKIIGRTFDKSIEIQTRPLPELPTVEADAGQIQQVLMNLCVNAADAMPLGGKLIIETKTETLRDKSVRGHTGQKAGEYVVLSVTDTGLGMDQETTQRIFEPFFTTKAEGKGTGLGLSMVYGVVKNHGGFISVSSEPGDGATFRISLPVSGKPETEESAKSESFGGGNELILVADDEEAIRDLVNDILETYGYRVLLAGNGAEAVELYADRKDEIGLVVLDMVMPKMGGREAFLKLKDINPKVKALLSSGYSQTGKAQEIIDIGVLGFIQKPYQAEELLSEIRNALDSKV